MRYVTLALAAAALSLGGCSAANRAGLTGSVPACTDVTRVALVAQSVPTASYVPCLGTLPAGWTSRSFDAVNGRTRFLLVSDRAGGRPVRVELRESCDSNSATPTTPRAAGVRTSIELRSISPRYAGRLIDVFAGGCITYQFDFQRGPHIALMEDFEGAIALVSRQELVVAVHDHVGVSLDP